MHPAGGDIGDRGLQRIKIERLHRRCTRMSQVQDPAARASNRARQAVRLRNPGSHDRVTPWKAVVMPLASNCASVSRSARSAGNPPPAVAATALESVAVQIDDPGSTSRPEASAAHKPNPGRDGRSSRPAATNRWAASHRKPRTVPPVIQRSCMCLTVLKARKRFARWRRIAAGGELHDRPGAIHVDVFGDQDGPVAGHPQQVSLGPGSASAPSPASAGADSRRHRPRATPR